MISEIGDAAQVFFQSNFNKALFVLLLLLGIGLFFLSSPPAQEQEGSSFVHFFYLPTCPVCHEQMQELNQLLEQKYGIKIISHDVSSQKGSELFGKICSEKGLPGLVPTTLVGDRIFIGFDETTGKSIESAVNDCLQGNCTDPLTGQTCGKRETSLFVDILFFGTIDARSFSLPVLAIVLGLVDGFNPCAMWILVYLIALVMRLNDKKKVWLIVGSFVLASGILYFLFMTAWLNAFLLVGYTKIVTLLIGLVALGGGVLSIKGYLQSRGKSTGCKIVNPKQKRKTMEKIQEIVSKPTTLATIVAIIILAFAVNSIEFVCSSAIPAIFTQVLAISGLEWWERYAYIALYDFFFMLDDIIIFSLAAITVNSSFGEKYEKYCKIIGGIVLLALGLLLLFAPQLLR